MSGTSSLAFFGSSAVRWLNVVCRYKVVRGTLDFSGVVGRVTARSKYGGMSHSRICSRMNLTILSYQQNVPNSSDDISLCLASDLFAHGQTSPHYCSFARTLHENTICALDRHTPGYIPSARPSLRCVLEGLSETTSQFSQSRSPIIPWNYLLTQYRVEALRWCTWVLG